MNVRAGCIRKPLENIATRTKHVYYLSLRNYTTLLIQLRNFTTLLIQLRNYKTLLIQLNYATRLIQLRNYKTRLIPFSHLHLIFRGQNKRCSACTTRLYLDISRRTNHGVVQTS